MTNHPAIDASLPDDADRLVRHIWARNYLRAAVRRVGTVDHTLLRLELVLAPDEAKHIREVWESIAGHATAWAEERGYFDLEPDELDAVMTPRLVELLSFRHPTELLPAVDEPMRAVVMANVLLGAQGHPSRWFESDLANPGG